MKRSVSVRITFVTIILIITTIGFCILANSFFLESYYTGYKQDRLKYAYDFIQSAIDEDRFSNGDFDMEFKKLCTDEAMSISVLNADGSVEKTSDMDDLSVRMQIMDMLFGNLDEYHNVISRTENYTIYRSKDKRMQTEYLVLWGSLSDGDLIAVRSAVENIREGAGLSNRFLIIVGLIAMVVAGVVAAFMGKSIARPLKQLTVISGRMSSLDFDARYKENKSDSSEVSELGQNMNKLSASLENTISKFKKANNELMLDNERKTKVDEMRKEFLSNVSHELKTPLALISGYAEGLRDLDENDTDSRDYYIDVITDETNKMTGMVGKLLTLNRIEFGTNEVEFVRFDITQVIASVCLQMEKLAAQRGITVRFDEAQEIVWSDEFQIEEVITNYLSNAINHCYDNGRIDIFYERRDGIVRVNVFNTGDPIPEEALDKVWIKFFKVDKARTREYGGSGIGLSIVKAIMDSLGKGCGVRNEKGGVLFWFEAESAGKDI